MNQNNFQENISISQYSNERLLGIYHNMHLISQIISLMVHNFVF